jgi:transposase
MKNLMDPELLAQIQALPKTCESVESFLKENPELKPGIVCRTMGLPPSSFYSWRSRKLEAQDRRNLSDSALINSVEPTGSGKREYSAQDKIELLKVFDRLEESKRGEFLRKFGLYHSNLDRWREVIDKAGIEALGKKKKGPAGKTDDQRKIEELQRELMAQEKVITRLSAIATAQKKVSEILGIKLPDLS